MKKYKLLLIYLIIFYNKILFIVSEAIGQYNISKTTCNATEQATPHYSSSNIACNENQMADPPKESTSDLLQHLISEAVKKVLSENACLSSFIDPNAIVKNLDTNSLITKAVKEISSDVQMQENHIKEKKQPRLYLPPPGTPSYKPTPISQLQEKNSKTKPTVTLSIDEEYTPTSIGNTVNMSNEAELTDFSADEEENENEAKSEFDMLEEVLVESSADPTRKKAILKRKKALGKLASANISTKSQPITNRESKNNGEKEINKDTTVAYSTCIDDTFHPPSPIFTSSSESSMARYTSSNMTNNTNVAANAIKKKDDAKTKVDESKEIASKSDTLSNCGSCSKSNSLPISSTHNLLPQIAELSRPNIKSWSPVAKVDSLLSVEKMLEQLDSLPSEKKALLQGNNLREVVEPVKNSTLQKAKLKPEVSQNEEKSTVPLNSDTSFEKGSQEKSLGKKKTKNESSTQQKRSFDDENSSDMEKKKIKKKHPSRKKQKRHRSKSSSDSYSSSESESDEKPSSEDSSSGELSKKRKKKRKRSGSRHRKHKLKRRKSKYKKKKSTKRSRSRSKSLNRKHSYKYSSSKSSGNSSSSSIRSPEKSHNIEQPIDVLLDESQIKKESSDSDLTIVKIEKVLPDENSQIKSDDSCTLPNNESSKSDKHSISQKENAPRELSVLNSLSFQSSKENSVSENSLKTQETKETFRENKSSTSNESKSSKSANKPKVLKEFSIFDNLTDLESLRKKVGRQNSSVHKDISFSKLKEEESIKKSCQEDLRNNFKKSHSSKSKFKDTHKHDKVQTSLKKHSSSHSSERKKVNKDDAQGTSVKDKSRFGKESEKNKDKNTPNSDRTKSNLHNRSKSSKHEGKSHKKENFEHKDNKKKQEVLCNNVNSNKEKRSSEHRIEKFKETSSTKELESVGK